MSRVYSLVKVLSSTRPRVRLLSKVSFRPGCTPQLRFGALAVSARRLLVVRQGERVQVQRKDPAVLIG